MKSQCDRPVAKHGFALVVTLSLMILLSLLAVGLLSLSSVALRESANGHAMRMAQANARVAMMLALADLQKQLGADNRITAPADQFLAANSEGGTANSARHYTGAYEAWDIGAPTRPNPRFLWWFVSGDRSKLTDRNWATSAAESNSVALVSERSAGNPGGAVKAPVLKQELPNGGSAHYAWWVSDLGTKALVAPAKEPADKDLAAARADAQTMPSYPLAQADVNGRRPFQAVSMNDPSMPRVVTLESADLLAGGSANAASGLIHDFTAFNRGLLTNVRRGGFRKDLSLYLEKPVASIPTEALYRVAGRNGINMSELWLHYNMWRELRHTGRFNYTTGGSIRAGTPYLQMEGSLSATYEDREYYYKQPTFVQYQTLLSFHARPGTQGGATGRFLQIVVDPVVTYWNPLDVPVVVTPAYNSIKFWQLPYDVRVEAAGRTSVTSLQRLLGGSEWHYLTLIAGKTQPMVLKPGEVLMVSQGPSTPIFHQTRKGIAANYFDAVAGWNFGGGIAFDMVDANNNPLFYTNDTPIRYEVTPNSIISSGTRRWSINHHECYFKEDREGRGESIGIGGIFIDYIYGQPYSQDNPKPENLRLTAAARPDFFGKIPPEKTRVLSLEQVTGRKEPFMLYSFRAKTERGSERPSRFLARFNPKAMLTDFLDLRPAELDVLPFEVQINPLNSFKTPLLEVSSNGNGYFGGGTNAQDGTPFVTTHSVPREPIISLAAMQHAFANGFTTLSPQSGYAVINGRQPFLPQISHPIGNSFAPSVIAANRTDGMLSGNRPLADHSYLANQALWDDWFFSGIAPQEAPGFSNRRNQRTVASDFLAGTAPLPAHRYRPALGGTDPKDILPKLFSGSRVTPQGHLLTAMLLEVDGLFNVNSTSVEAWKSVFSALKDRHLVTRDLNGAETPSAVPYDTPVANLNAPMDMRVARGQPADIKEPAQWLGYRTLNDEEIDELARAVVREVRKRGPFLSLADFINRRPSNDPEVALSGAIQSALDSPSVSINKPFRGAGRQVALGNSATFPFPQAESGPAATGIPGIVKQADILTPIAPYLSARSDSFLIRACGRVTDAKGAVIATAYCEAEVQRTAAFMDPLDTPDTLPAKLAPLNKTFGRRFEIVSFRWLDPATI